ncbi:L-2-hydroxyglutarate dehydrogenase, mitochondrial [Psilocybe cubensis]|uniref:L-2-hydroxyglutarate dehydrogenase, mitochondrial n=2 Tax=Psilocybe cubensis TaxID=181762 RepID=A0A8H8CKR1_PSICU|nr:L-2-hydroxyglutarate dehydrogenase, mitochondrial [Psilocybe cubensis]KAH9482469.1 L-2-hydroxyglutarate dehydrogenase, mitochondrial [Psilocybe cubensis]
MRSVKGLTRALNDSGRFRYKDPEAVVDFLIVGGGVVGLAVAQRLTQCFPYKSTYLVERHSRAGEETRYASLKAQLLIACITSHVTQKYDLCARSYPGLYYPPESLKTKLCLRGRDLMYERCITYNIPYKQTGKLVVAKANQLPYIQSLYTKSLKLKWPPYSSTEAQKEPVLPTKLLSREAIEKLEPDLSTDIVAALWCPKTGIVDSHSFMESLEQDVIDSEEGQLVFNSEVVRIDRYRNPSEKKYVGGASSSEEGWVVQVRSEEEETYSLLARTLINASGLSSVMVLNSLLPQDKRIPMFYARGSYASYHGPGVSDIKHLIYPCPHTGPNAHAFESLGTHLTLDLQGKIRFGPDIEWIDIPEEDIKGTEEDTDFWTKWLKPDDSRLPDIHQAVTSYLPGVTLEGLQPDYVGIRPKLIPPGGGFQDFLFRTDYPDEFTQRNGSNPMVSLLGIESPGLTSSLAIAEMVVDGMLKR